LEGYDTFDGTTYPLDGAYGSREAAVGAADARLVELERSQPSASSGGQNGIQDQVFLVAPDGTRTRHHGSSTVPEVNERGGDANG
jgi:hypothetical protein